MKRLLQILILLLVIHSCSESDSYQFPEPEDLSCDYFPLDSGMWRDFKVTKIKIDEPILLHDTQIYFLRERLGGTFVDNEGDTLRQIERFIKNEESANWERKNTWLVYKKNTEVIQIEENTRYVKMQLPLLKGKKWNGNIYNRTDTLQEYEYCVESFDYNADINGFLFDSVVTISQKNELTAITKVWFSESYASGVGLVRKQMIDIYSDIYDPAVEIDDRITKGTIADYVLIGFGND